MTLHQQYQLSCSHPSCLQLTFDRGGGRTWADENVTNLENIYKITVKTAQNMHTNHSTIYKLQATNYTTINKLYNYITNYIQTSLQTTQQQVKQTLAHKKVHWGSTETEAPPPF